MQCSALTLVGDARSESGATWTYITTTEEEPYRLSGTVLAPDGAGPFPAVLVHNGTGGDPASGETLNTMKTFRSWGAVAFAVRSTHATVDQLDGQPLLPACSPACPLPGQTCGGACYGASPVNLKRTQKARALLACLQSRSDIAVDDTRVATHGHSRGAFLNIAVAASMPTRFLVASHTAGGVAPASAQEGLTASPLRSVAALVRAPYQLHHSPDDDAVNIGTARPFADILEAGSVPYEFHTDYTYGAADESDEPPDNDHAGVAGDALMFERVRAWYRGHGMFPDEATDGGTGTGSSSGLPASSSVGSPASSGGGLDGGPGCAPDEEVTAGPEQPDCAAANYTVQTLTYATTSPNNVLDLYIPNTGSGPWPTVVWIHGGGWQNGTKANVLQARWLVCQGYAVASVEYRLSGEATFPAQIHDVKAGIRFLRAHAATYGLDPNRFATFGSSAGGHLSALAATTGDETDLEDLTQGNASASSAVQAAVDWYGPTRLQDMDAQADAIGCGSNHDSPTSAESNLLGCTLQSCSPTLLAQVDPTTHVGPSEQPFLLMHGLLDCTVAHGQSELLRDVLRAAGHCPLYRSVSNAEHGGPAWNSAEARQQVLDFLQSRL